MIPRNGIRIGRFRGIEVLLHWSWFLVFFLILWLVVLQFQAYGDSPPHRYVPMSVLTTLLFFVSVLLHELSHSIVANRNGVPIRRITLFVFGGVAQMSRDVPSPGVEFKMAIAGPLFSYLLCCAFGAVAVFAYLVKADTAGLGFAMLSLVNFGLGTFNLIPGFPLDGGRVLRSLLWHHSGDLEKSTRTACRFGQGVGIMLIAGGFAAIAVDLFSPPYDLLLGSLWFVFIGTFLVQAASASYRQVKLRLSLAGLSVRDAMRAGVPAVEASTTLEEVYRLHLERAPLSAIPVLRQGRLSAAVRLLDLRTVPRPLWPDTPVAQVARPLASGDTVGSEEPLFDALAAMERSKREFLWAVDGGRLAGVILKEDALRPVRNGIRPTPGSGGRGA